MGLRLPDLVQKVSITQNDTSEELALAVIWHMIANHTLRFNPTRRLLIEEHAETSEFVSK